MPGLGGETGLDWIGYPKKQRCPSGTQLSDHKQAEKLLRAIPNGLREKVPLRLVSERNTVVSHLAIQRVTDTNALPLTGIYVLMAKDARN